MRGFFFSNMKQAIFNIECFRFSNTINKSLPVVLFAGCDFFSGYSQSLRGTLPNGIDVTSVLNQPKGIRPESSVRFVYNEPSTGSTDVFYTSANEIPITTLAVNGIQKPFYIKQINYTISDLTKTRQFFEKINLIKLDLFGKTITDSFVPNMYRNDMLKFNESIEIPVNIKIDGNSGLAINLLPEANFSVNLSFIIEQ